MRLCTITYYEFLMEINSKIHAEQLAPPGVQRGMQGQRSHKRDGQTDRQTDRQKNGK